MCVCNHVLGYEQIGMERHCTKALDKRKQDYIPGTKFASSVPAMQWGGYGSSGLSGWWESRNPMIGLFFSQNNLASLSDSLIISEIWLLGSLGAWKVKTHNMFHT